MMVLVLRAKLKCFPFDINLFKIKQAPSKWNASLQSACYEQNSALQCSVLPHFVGVVGQIYIFHGTVQKRGSLSKSEMRTFHL